MLTDFTQDYGLNGKTNKVLSNSEADQLSILFRQNSLGQSRLSGRTCIALSASRVFIYLLLGTGQ